MFASHPKAADPLDLSFSPFDRDLELTVLPGDLAVLMVGIAARQAASPTALCHAGVRRARIDHRLFAPIDGAFNGQMASAMITWKEP